MLLSNVKNNNFYEYLKLKLMVKKWFNENFFFKITFQIYKNYLLKINNLYLFYKLKWQKNLKPNCIWENFIMGSFKYI